MRFFFFQNPLNKFIVFKNGKWRMFSILDNFSKVFRKKANKIETNCFFFFTYTKKSMYEIYWMLRIKNVSILVVRIQITNTNTNTHMTSFLKKKNVYRNATKSNWIISWINSQIEWLKSNDRTFLRFSAIEKILVDSNC